jgi:hypothetical protein
MMGADLPGAPREPGEDPAPDERPYGTRPYGTRPYGTRPYGTRAYGTRPYGTRPYGTRPEDGDEDRPYGTRPYGTRPYGTRPYGTRPYGTRPYGTREDDGTLDGDEWADDVADLFCAASAVVSLGASIVFADSDGDTPVPSIEGDPRVARYMDTQRRVIDPCPPDGVDSPEPGEPEKPSRATYRRILRPRDHELAVTAVVPDDLARDIAERRELAWPLKQDLARLLAIAADNVFLRGRGRGTAEPCGISTTDGVGESAAGADVVSLRRLLSEVRATDAVFRAPGFILDSGTFDAVTQIPVAAGGDALDTTNLLDYDSRLLFGCPYAITPAADGQVYFSADWGEAWIAFDRRLVTIDLSTDAHFQSDETVLRAVSRHDFVVRRPQAFRYMTWEHDGA